MILLKIAWRNIWRNKLRSWVVIAAIALGIWAGTFIISFAWGMYNHRIDNAIKNEISNIQVHDSLFLDEYRVNQHIKNPVEIRENILKLPQVSGVSNRTISMGMIASAQGNAAIKLLGIDTLQERSVHPLSANLIEGKILQGTHKNAIVIGEALANKLNVHVKSTLVATFEDAQGNITHAAFKVTGIYKTANSKYDELHAFVVQSDLQRLLAVPGMVHEIAVRLHQNKNTTKSTQNLQEMLPHLSVQSWEDLLPEMAYAMEMFDKIMQLIIFIIMLALVFGIVNTMLMAILERVNELGMLMSIGMNKTKIFVMIMLESILISGVGAPLGLLLSYFSIQFWGHVGIDLSDFALGMNNLGFNSVVYPKAEPNTYYSIVIQVILVTLIASIIPARRALKLNPIEAINSL